jgi:hypothetical protein
MGEETIMPPTERRTTTRASAESKLPPTIESELLTNGDEFFNGKAQGIPDIEMDLPKSKAETELILKSLAKTYALTAQFVMLISIQDGALIAQNIDSLTESWRQLLDDDVKLRKTMLKLVKSSGWGTVISAHLAIGLPIAVNHKDSFAHLIKPKPRSDQQAYDTAA